MDAAGFGYLAMFLSELLPASLVDRIVLLDKAWPMHSQQEVTEGQINPAHVFLEGWPVRLTTSKNNLKTPSGRRGIYKTVFDDHSGPVIILGIHLCGQLSVQAVELFNTQPAATMIALKPCCLPQLWAGMTPAKWEMSNGTVIDVANVGIKGRFVKNIWRGPDRNTMVHKFAGWADSLFEGMDCPEIICEPCEPGAAEAASWKESECLSLWEDKDNQGSVDTGKYQNRYLWGFRTL